MQEKNSHGGQLPRPLYMPDHDGGYRPAPSVLVEEEVIAILRLNEPGGPKNPSDTLKYYRDKRLLRGCKIGNVIRYPAAEIERFLATKVAFDASSN